MADRTTLLQTGLNDLHVEESTFLRGMVEKGALANARAAVVTVLQARFPGAHVPAGVHSALEKNAIVQQLTDWLREAAVTASPADFERFLKGIEQGSLAMARAVVVNVLKARFPEMPLPEGVRSALEKNVDIRQLTDWHRVAVLITSPADFERFLAPPGNFFSPPAT